MRGATHAGATSGVHDNVLRSEGFQCAEESAGGHWAWAVLPRYELVLTVTHVTRGYDCTILKCKY